MSLDELNRGSFGVDRTHDACVKREADLAAQLEASMRALNATLLFWSAGTWDAAKRARWVELTGAEECTSKSLCDFVRQTLALVGA